MRRVKIALGRGLALRLRRRTHVAAPNFATAVPRDLCPPRKQKHAGWLDLMIFILKARALLPSGGLRHAVLYRIDGWHFDSIYSGGLKAQGHQPAPMM